MAVKLEPTDDVKEFQEFLNESKVGEAAVVVPASNLWSFLVTRTRFLYQKEHGLSLIHI